jgi:DNA invertase Pin-like site-specific DNA recombinase
VFQMMCSIAEFECNMISERVKAGLYAARANGKVLGAPSKPDVYIQMAKKMKDVGMTYRQIQKTMKEAGFNISLGSLSKYL